MSVPPPAVPSPAASAEASAAPEPPSVHSASGAGDPRSAADLVPPALPGRPAEPLAAVDRAWLRMDEPANLMVINGVLVFHGPVDPERLRGLFRRRLLPIRRFRQRVVRDRRGRAAWQDDPAFDLDRHLLVEPLHAGAGAAHREEEDDDEALRRVVGGWMGEPLDPERPPWRFHLVTGYRGGAALVARLHHVIGDGIALMLVLLSLTDLDAAGHSAGEALADAEAAEPVLANPFATLFAQAEADLEAVREATERVMPEGMKLLLKPAQALRSAGRLIKIAAGAGALGRLALRRRDPRTVFKGPLGIEKRVAWSRPIALAEVRDVAAALGGRTNDVLHAAAAGGLRRYLLRHGEPPERLVFRAAVPVNLRPLAEMSRLGNRFGLVFLGLPVGIAEPRRRIAELARRVRALKHSAEPLVTFAVLGLLGRVPRPAQRLVVRLLATKTTAVLTSVPGPQQSLYLAGRRIEELFFWVPQAGRVGLGLSICSYDGHVRMGVATDAGLVPDPETVVAAIEEELAALAAAAAAAGPGI